MFKRTTGKGTKLMQMKYDERAKKEREIRKSEKGGWGKREAIYYHCECRAGKQIVRLGLTD
jgi:hypothetical protein